LEIINVLYSILYWIDIPSRIDIASGTKFTKWDMVMSDEMEERYLK